MEERKGMAGFVEKVAKGRTAVEDSTTVSFRLNIKEGVDRFVYEKLMRIGKGERSRVIKVALYNYFARTEGREPVRLDDVKE